jgi:hypothetical protein
MDVGRRIVVGLYDVRSVKASRTTIAMTFVGKPCSSQPPLHYEPYKCQRGPSVYAQREVTRRLVFLIRTCHIPIHDPMSCPTCAKSTWL